jgi:two-component system, NtrC family, nitrogen regulation sensor histidine kinase NtrY
MFWKFVIPGALVALLGGLWGWEYFAIRQADADWDRISNQTRANAERMAAADFHVRQDRLRVLVEGLASRPVLRQGLLGGVEERRAAFKLLAEAAAAGTGLELRGPDGETIAWGGTGGPTPAFLVRAAIGNTTSSSVIKSPIGAQLVVATSVPSEGRPPGVLVGRIPISASYALSNRFIQSTSLADEISARAGTRVEFQFDDPTYDEGVVITGVDGAMIGFAAAAPPDRGATMAAMRDDIASVRMILLVALLVLAGIGIWLEVRRRRSRGVAIVVAVVLLLGLRIAILALGFPSGLSQSGIFDSALFASAFAGGIARSIAEFLISSVVVLAALVLLGKVVPDTLPAWICRRPLGVRVAGAVLIAVLVVWGLRGVAAVVRSAVYDSVLGLADPGPIIPSLPLAALTAALLITMLCYVMVALRGLHFMRQLTDVEGSRFAGAAIAIVLLIATSLFFGTRPSPLIPPALRWVILGVLTLLAWARFWQGSSFVRHASRTLISAAFLVPLLMYHTEGKERRKIETLASQILRPVDAWLTVVVDEGLTRLSDPARVASLKAWDEADRSGAAFEGWASSVASREGYASVFAIVDTTGLQVSRFSIGGMTAALRSVEFELGPVGERLILAREVGKGPDAVMVYAGVTPMLGADGVIQGYARVLIAAGRQALFRGENPSILRTATSNDRVPDVVVSEFRSGRLETSTESIYPLGYTLPEAVRANLASDPSAGVWWSDAGEDGDFSTWYVARPGGEGVIGLSIPDTGSTALLLVLVRVLIVAGCLLVLFGGVLVAAHVGGGRSVHVSFRDRLLAALVISALVPLVFMTIYGQRYSRDRLREFTRQTLQEETAGLAARISAEHAFVARVGPPTEDITPGWVEALAAMTGTDFNVFGDSSLAFSSRPELFTLGVLDRRMNGSAFAAIMLEGKRFFMGMERIGLIEYAVGYRPILLDDDRVIGVVAVPTLFRQDRIEAETARQNAALFGIVAFVILTLIGIASFFANRFAAPIRKLTDATARVAAGDLDVTVAEGGRSPLLGGDEVQTLMRSFDSMTRDLKRGREELVRAEREMAWREMARQVAHEIKNPLTPMKLSIQHLRQTFRDRAPDFDRILEDVTRTVGEQIDALSRIASEFSRFARMPERQLARCDMNEVVGEAIRLFDREERVRFETNLAPGLPSVLADKEELRRAFINVIRNSVQAMGGQGTIGVATVMSGGRVTATLTDTGPGITDEVMPKLFTPNFSTKTDGMGLGLAMVKRMLDDIGGSIGIRSEQGKGVAVTITLPPAPAEAQP